MKTPYGFGLSQEDERTEAAALDLPGRHVLSIASAGDMALSLLALGAADVTAVDVAPSQLHLGELKRAAVIHLDREEATRFLGLLPATAAERQRWLTVLMEHLPAPARQFWSAQRRTALRGAIWGGRYEQYLGTVRTLVRPIAGNRFRRLVECRTIDEQRCAFARDFDRPVLRLMFRLMFHPRLYARRGMDPRALQHRNASESLGDRFFERFRAMCVGSPSRDNPLLQIHLLGRVRDSDVVPAYLTEHGVRVIRERAGAISFVHASVVDVLASCPPNRFDAFHLSNVADWLPAQSFEQLLAAIAGRARRPTRLIWRHLHCDHPIPDALKPVIRVNSALSARLQDADRFPVYGIAAAEIPA